MATQFDGIARYGKEQTMRLIDADELKAKLQEDHDFLVEAWGGFPNMPREDKVRADELAMCIARVVNAPTIDAVSVEWIPCEKRLPEETMLCLVTIKEQVTPIIDWWVADEPTTPDPAPGKWKDNKLTHIAWMPLIEPYEGREDNG